MKELASELKDCAALMPRLADAAGKEALSYFRNEAPVSNKAGIWFDPVTEADRACERVMRQMISHVFPRHAILGEEFGAHPGEGHDAENPAPVRWILDPIDGTRAFVCGVPSWMTLIGVECEGAPMLGTLDQPFTRERWIASDGKTRYFLRGTEQDCRVSTLTDISKARITTTDPRRTQGYFDSDQADAFRRLADVSRLARFSLDAYGYALLALGEIDVVLESGLAPHDYSALRPVVEGAGGVITNWRGDPVGTDDRGEVLAAATPKLQEAVMNVVAA
ncbi:MAG: inositol monophosphatase family protein [Pseudomonadota bacterium]